MGNEVGHQTRSTQTKNVDIEKFRSVISPFKTEPYCYLSRNPNTKTTQTEDAYTIKKKYQLKAWRLEEKMMPLCAKCLNCNCSYDCWMITTEDIAFLFKTLRETKDSFEQFKYLAQHIKLDPYRFRAQFYVRLKRQGTWIIRRTCIHSFRHIFRISNLELSELVKRIATIIKENKNCMDPEDSDDCNRQGYVVRLATTTKLQVRREVEFKWSRPDFRPATEDLSILESFGFSNCPCNTPRTLRHYLFFCPRFELTRNELLHFSSVEDLYKNSHDFVRYVKEFVFNVTSPQQ